jgi:3-hydroxyisobutyrate dehydrogenase
MHIGIAGLGRMGAAIGARVMEAGHRLSVWNRSPEKTRELAADGARVVSNPTELARRVETVITILTDAAAIDGVYHGPSGLLAGDVAGKLFIEMSTVQPKIEIALAEKVRAKGAAFVECPVGGTIGPAREGKLLGLVAGQETDVGRAAPLLEQLCRRLTYCGPTGSAASMKLAINLPLLVSWQAYGEALALAGDVPLDAQAMFGIWLESSGATNALKARAPALVSFFQDGKPLPVTFDINSAVKDLRTMLAEGQERGLELPLVKQALAAYEESALGIGEADAANQIVKWAMRDRLAKS